MGQNLNGSNIEPQNASQQPEPQLQPQPEPRPEPQPQPPSMVVKIQNATAAAQITALISFLIGGMALSCVSLVFSLKARRMLRELPNSGIAVEPLTALKLERGVKLSMGLAAVAFTLNLVLAIIFYPVVLNALETGNFESIFGTSGAGSSAASAKSASSVWG